MSNEQLKCQVIICKCEAHFAACTIPKCYEDKDWLLDLMKYSKFGYRVGYINAGEFKLQSCTCIKADKFKEPDLSDDEVGELLSKDHEIELLKSKIEELEEKKLTDFPHEDIEEAFLQMLNITRSIDNERKVDLLFENIDRFSLLQFETFLKEFTNTSIL